MKAKSALAALALGLGLALALPWILGNQPGPTLAAPECRPLQGDVITVCLSGGCDFNSVQDAVDAASDGDVIKVAAGTYTGVQVRTDITQVVHIDKSLTIQGGYSTSNWDTPDLEANPTVLDAQGQGRVLALSGAENYTVTLEGLQIVNGAFAIGGGGVYATNCHLTIRDCTIMNSDALHGGGIRFYNGTLIVENSHIMNNTAGNDGGGISTGSAIVTMTHNILEGNACGGEGGGVHFSAFGFGRGYVAHNVFQGNTGGVAGGGGVSVSDGDLILTDNVFRNNVADGNGGGLNASVGKINNTYSINHNTFQGNVASPEHPASGGGAFLKGSRNDSAWIIFSHNQVLDNIASGGTLTEARGGGVAVVDGPAVLADNLVQGNWAASHIWSDGRGGGVSLKGTNLWLERDRILDNHAARYAGYSPSVAAYGGGVYVDSYSSVTMTNNFIADNRYCDTCESHLTFSDSGGGGIKVGYQTSPNETQLYLYHNTIVNNESPAIENESSALNMSHNIFSGHTTDLRLVGHRGGGYPPPTTVANYTLWYPSMNIDRQEGTLITTHDFTGAPDFISPFQDNYHLGPNSQAIDKGVGIGVSSDIDGNPRPIDTGYDLGADEYTGADLSTSVKRAVPPTAAADAVVTYTIVLRNSGLKSCLNTQLWDAIPAATTLVPASADATSGSVTEAGGIRWQGNVASGAVVTITFQVTVNQGILIENTAVVTDAYNTVLNLIAWVNGDHVYLPLVMWGYTP